MQLKNLECQLAMAQFKRYSAGAKLSDEALEALESHLVDCPDCQKAVQALRPAPAASSHAVVETPAPTPARPEAPTSAHQAPKASPFAIAQLKKAGGQGNAKTLVLSISLGIVLVAMSALANDPTKLFGERAMKPGQSKQTPLASSAQPAASQPAASQPAASQPAPVVASATATQPANTPQAPVAVEPAREEEAAAPTAQESPREPERTPSEARNEPRAEPRRAAAPTRRSTPARRSTPVRRTTRATAPRRTTRQASAPRRAATPRPAPAPQRSNSGIRVYDENGRLIR